MIGSRPRSWRLDKICWQGEQVASKSESPDVVERHEPELLNDSCWDDRQVSGRIDLSGHFKNGLGFCGTPQRHMHERGRRAHLPVVGVSNHQTPLLGSSRGEGNGHRGRRYIGDQPNIDGNVSGSRVGLQCNGDLVVPFCNDASLVDGDILATMGSQERRQEPEKRTSLLVPCMRGRFFELEVWGGEGDQFFHKEVLKYCGVQS